MPRRTLGLRLGEREGVVVRDGVCLSMGRQRWQGGGNCKSWALRARTGWISMNIITMMYTCQANAWYLLVTCFTIVDSDAQHRHRAPYGLVASHAPIFRARREFSIAAKLQ